MSDVVAAGKVGQERTARFPTSLAGQNGGQDYDRCDRIHRARPDGNGIHATADRDRPPRGRIRHRSGKGCGRRQGRRYGCRERGRSRCSRRRRPHLGHRHARGRGRNARVARGGCASKPRRQGRRRPFDHRAFGNGTDRGGARRARCCVRRCAGIRRPGGGRKRHARDHGRRPRCRDRDDCADNEPSRQAHPYGGSRHGSGNQARQPDAGAHQLLRSGRGAPPRAGARRRRSQDSVRRLPAAMPGRTCCRSPLRA